MYIPEGFGTVFPYLFASDAAAYLTFLERAFGAEIVGKTEAPDGTVANARVRIGTTAFMVSEAGGVERHPILRLPRHPVLRTRRGSPIGQSVTQEGHADGEQARRGIADVDQGSPEEGCGHSGNGPHLGRDGGGGAVPPPSPA